MNKDRNPYGLKRGNKVRSTKAYRDKTGNHFTGVVLVVLVMNHDDLATIKFDKAVRTNVSTLRVVSMSAAFAKRRRRPRKKWYI